MVPLEYLILKENNLTSIPTQIGNLVNLTSLDLTQNNLTSIPQDVCDLETNHDVNILLDAGVSCQ